jgi:hypothetical protein
MAGFREIVGELNRRGVLKAGGFYLAGSWLFLQVLDVLQKPLRLSDWVLSLEP